MICKIFTQNATWHINFDVLQRSQNIEQPTIDCLKSKNCMNFLLDARNYYVLESTFSVSTFLQVPNEKVISLLKMEVFTILQEFTHSFRQTYKFNRVSIWQ